VISEVVVVVVGRNMAYRRRQSLSRASTFKEEFHDPSSLDVAAKDSDHNHASPPIPSPPSSSTSSSSLPTQPTKPSASRYQPSLSFAFATPDSDSDHDHQRSKVFIPTTFLSSISHHNSETLDFVYR